jgi:catechol-2,3-dioxygenase
MDYKLEVVTLAVRDVDAARDFYGLEAAHRDLVARGIKVGDGNTWTLQEIRRA